MKQKTVPELRFPEFTGNWEEKRTKLISPLQRGFDLPKRDIVEGKYPVVYSNGILRNHKEFKVEGPGVVTGRSGTIGKVTYIEGDFWPHNTSLWVTNFKNNHPKFIYFFYINFKLERYNAGSTVPTLNRNDVHFIKKRIPTYKEQQKIAEFLTSVDKHIQTLEKKKSLLEDYKKGVMQKIFNQEIRFKDDNGNDFPDWEKKRLSNLGQTFSGLKSKTKEDFGKGKPYIQYKQIFDDSVIKLSQCGFVNIKEGEDQNSVKYGDILFTVSSETPEEIGFSSVFLEKNVDVYLNSFCFGFRIKSSQALNPEFSHYLFRSQDVRKDIIKLGQGSTRYNMSKKEFIKIDINIPDEEEQKKIANFLSAIDQKIKAVEEKLTHTQAYKKGLLQRMFV